MNSITKVRVPSILCEDGFCWPREPFGEYSVKSGYRLLREKYAVTDTRKPMWLKIWQCRVPPKLKVFVWRLLHGILPMRTSLFQRHVIPSSHCLTCGEGPETNDHCFGHCRWARDVWNSSGLSSNPSTVMGDNCVARWIEQVAVGGIAGNLEQVIMLLWCMWKCRNACVFENKVMVPAGVHVRASMMQQQYLQAINSDNRLRERPRQQFQWQPPLGDVLKVNCDGSRWTCGRSGVGGICRNSDGAVMGCFSIPVTFSYSVKEIEAHAVKEALVFAKDCGFRRISVETDAQEIVQEIRRNQLSCSMHSDIIQEIRMLQCFFELCSFHFVPRLCNAVADRLASCGVTETQPMFWLEEIPTCISDVILSDI